MKYSVYDDMSNPEKEVADYLRDLDLWWLYEYPVFVYDEKERPRVWTPDFYIPALGMYVEVCGAERDYTYRDEIYQKTGYNVIFVHLYKEGTRWRNYLLKRIKDIKEKRHEQVMKMLDRSDSR